MTRRIPPHDTPRHELVCLAQHPAARKRGEPDHGRNPHGALVQPFPLACRPVLDRSGRPRVVAQWEEVHGHALATAPGGQIRTVLDGERVRFGVRCPESGCKRITVYEIISLP